MIIKQLKQVDNNCVRCSRAVKACSETKFKSPSLHINISNFSKAVQILDIVQGLTKLPKLMNIFLKIYILSMKYETSQRMKDLLIGRHICINLRQDHVKKS